MFVDEKDVTKLAINLLNKTPRPLNPSISNFDILNAQKLIVVKIKQSNVEIVEVPKDERVLKYMK